jgi:hypothetical protein
VHRNKQRAWVFDLLDHLVGAQDEPSRYFVADRLSSVLFTALSVAFGALSLSAAFRDRADEALFPTCADDAAAS